MFFNACQPFFPVLFLARKFQAIDFYTYMYFNVQQYSCSECIIFDEVWGLAACLEKKINLYHITAYKNTLNTLYQHVCMS